jgi:hypothetical protein
MDCSNKIQRLYQLMRSWMRSQPGGVTKPLLWASEDQLCQGLQHAKQQSLPFRENQKVTALGLPELLHGSIFRELNSHITDLDGRRLYQLAPVQLEAHQLLGLKAR